MRKISKTPCNSMFIGELTDGCKLCIKGEKLVLFVTGKCNVNCEYCTVSEKRYGKDEVWANEKKVERDEDIINEAKICSSSGAGITGGEPLIELERTIKYIKLLKQKFGKKFQIHLYTSGILENPEEVCKKLNEAGLDELRIHSNKEFVKVARKWKNWKVGMEIPVFPGKENDIIDLIKFLEEIGADFINLNELEFSDRNIEFFKKQGFELREDSLTAVKGSIETAEKILEWAKENTNKINIHFCTASLKLNCQLRNRLINRAKGIKKPFEKISKDGFIIKGILFDAKIEDILNFLKSEKISEKNYFVNKDKNRVETSEFIAKILVKKKPNFKIAIVEEYPSADPWDFELTPLNY
ncbi:MAG: radical SAM protein [Candidatus Aenigmatarchaeota archaeon]